MNTDLEGLLTKGVITQETYDWLKPLHDQENADLEEIRRAALERKTNPFYKHDSDEESDDDDLTTTTTTTLHGIEGTATSISFVTDNNSSGHGNKVWHASIATCRYLKDYFLPLLVSGERKFIDGDNCTVRCLELGAGTAVPSFFLAHLLKDAKISSPKHVVLRITDAKYYRNIMQIIRSIEIQKSLTDDASLLTIQVHPHNWGEPIGFEKNNDNDYPHDLVIVSDCIYDPSYHNDLLVSLSRTLRLPICTEKSNGGIAVVSFSLHGNVQDSAIWEFLESKLPSTIRKDDTGKGWRLKALCVSLKEPTVQEGSVIVREGWHMETTMNELGMVTEGIKPERWLAYVYEITWVPIK